MSIIRGRREIKVDTTVGSSTLKKTCTEKGNGPPFKETHIPDT